LDGGELETEGGRGGEAGKDFVWGEEVGVDLADSAFWALWGGGLMGGAEGVVDVD
jgi:hypothetical protein